DRTLRIAPPEPSSPRASHRDSPDRYREEVRLRPFRPVLIGYSHRRGFETRAEGRARSVSGVVVRKKSANPVLMLFERGRSTVVEDCQEEVTGTFARCANIEGRILARSAGHSGGPSQTCL